MRQRDPRFLRPRAGGFRVRLLAACFRPVRRQRKLVLVYCVDPQAPEIVEVLCPGGILGSSRVRRMLRVFEACTVGRHRSFV